MRLFEEFMNDAYEMQSIMDQLKNRINYWFQKGEFSMRSNKVDFDISKSPNSSKKSMVINFNDTDFYYQMIIRMNIEDLENCDVVIKKYDPNTIDRVGGGEPISKIELTNSNKVPVDDLKEDFIIKKLSELEDKKENPDENEIKQPKEFKKEIQKGQTPTPQGFQTAQGAPPQQGGVPQGAPPQQGGVPQGAPTQGVPPQGAQTGGNQFEL